MGKEESAIQSVIIDYLQILENQGKLFFQRTNNIAVSDIRDGKRFFRAMPKGAHKGFPDLIIIKNGALIGIEVKSKKGKQSKEQKKIEEQFIKNGATYFVVSDLNKLIDIVS